MKKLSIFTVLILTTIILSSCDVNDSYYNDYTPPSPPIGIQVLNGDSRVDISWDQVTEKAMLPDIMFITITLMMENIP